MSALAGRTALVTGAGNGLGRAMAVHLANAGARVVLVGRDEEKLSSTAALIETDAVRTAACDVADPGSVDELRTTLADEQVTILVNNAGVAGPVSDLVDIDPADWDEVFAVNVRGVFLMCRAFVPAMVGLGGGDVVNVASVSGKRPLARRTPYCASKMAVIGLTTTLAYELGPDGIRVNTLSPGPVRGPRMSRNFTLEAERTGVTYEEAESAFVSRAALGRLIEESEVGASLVAMLQMPGLTGADVDLSGGMVAR